MKLHDFVSRLTLHVTLISLVESRLWFARANSRHLTCATHAKSMSTERNENAVYFAD